MKIFKKLGLMILSLALVIAFVSLTGTDAKADTVISDVSMDVDNPVQMEFGTVYSAAKNTAATGYGSYYIYSFTLSNKAKVTFDITPDVADSDLSYYLRCNGSMVSDTLTDYNTSMALDAGTYQIWIRRDKCNFTMKLTKEELQWGTVSFTWSGYTFTATYKPAGTADQNNVLTYWYCQASSSSENAFSSNTGKASGTVSFGSTTAAGWKKLEVIVKNTEFGESKTYTTYVAKKPAKVSFSQANMTAYKNSIKFGGTTSGYGLGTSLNGDKIDIQFYQGGKWVSKKKISSNGTGTVSGLKANTTYKVRVRGMVSATGSMKAIYGAVSSTMTVKTGDATPSIKAVKTGKAKYSYVKKVWHSGYWSSTGHWYAGYYTGGYYKTTYTITVTLKKALKSGQKLLINNKVCKGSGKTFTLSTYSTGKKIGKSVTLSIRSIQNTKYKGYSNVVKKKVTIRK